MDERPICDERILEAIEACRPGSDDVADPALVYLAAELAANPELEDLYERLQQVDAMLAAEVRDVSVPEGLQQRLLDRLAAVRPRQPLSDETAETAETGAIEPAMIGPAEPQRAGRRWLLVAAGIATTAAALLVVTLMNVRHAPQYTPETALVDAIKFFNDESPDSAAGKLLADDPPPGDYPLGPHISRFAGMRWREIGDFLGHRGVAYDIVGRDGTRRATLYVVEGAIDGLPTQPTHDPQHTTAMRCSSAWQQGRLLYVLVVHGSLRTYRGCLRPARPVA